MKGIGSFFYVVFDFNVGFVFYRNVCYGCECFSLNGM